MDHKSTLYFQTTAYSQPNGCEFEQTPGDGEGQGSLVRFSPWACKELDMTE